MTQIENEQIKALREELKETNSYIMELTKGVNDLQNAIKGNDLTHDGGLVKRLNDVEAQQKASDERHEKVEEWQKKAKWTAGIILGLFGLVEVVYQCITIYLTISEHKPH